MRKIILIATWMLICIASSFAHGEVHEKISALSAKIKLHPDSALLYLRRGELYHQDEQYKKAIKDFKSGKRKGLSSDRLYIASARSFYKRKRYRKALRILKRVLEKNPTQVRALRLKGNILLDRKKYCQAIEPFDLVISNLSERLVENYLEAAAACRKCKNPGSQQEAAQRLEQGIEDLGPLLLFFEKLKELALDEQNYQEAVLQQTAIIKYSIRKEKPYLERALLYIKNAEFEKANTDLKTSQSLLNQLPIRFQKMEAMQKLRQQLADAFLLLNTQSPPY